MLSFAPISHFEAILCRLIVQVLESIQDPTTSAEHDARLIDSAKSNAVVALRDLWSAGPQVNVPSFDN